MGSGTHPASYQMGTRGILEYSGANLLIHFNKVTHGQLAVCLRCTFWSSTYCNAYSLNNVTPDSSHGLLGCDTI